MVGTRRHPYDSALEPADAHADDSAFYSAFCPTQQFAISLSDCAANEPAHVATIGKSVATAFVAAVVATFQRTQQAAQQSTNTSAHDPPVPRAFYAANNSAERDPVVATNHASE